MPSPITVSVNATAFGQQYTDDQSVNADTGIVLAPSIAVAKIGSLTTRTDDDTGVLTMGAGHGITTAAKLDVFWDGGSRANMTVGTVAINSVPIDGGTGDVLPANLTATTAAVPTTEVAVIDGDDLVAFGFRSNDTAAIFTVCETNGTTVLLTVRLDAYSSYIWTNTNGTTNPLAATAVGTVRATHAGSSAAQTMNSFLAHN